MKRKVVITACVCLAIVLGVCGLYFYTKPAAAPGVSPSATTTPVAVQQRAAEPAQSQSGAWHTGITATVFWVGEGADEDNGHISNQPSAWDENWVTHFGGVDTPNQRSGFNPSGFVPRENPFYVALPYNDIDENGNTKPQKLCAAFSPQPAKQQQCKNTWVQITYQDKTAYAQWEDVGPFGENDAVYVFGTARPTNTTDTAAGIDVSPAVRDYLGLSDVTVISWRFVRPSDVPGGRWKVIVTDSTY